jgi:hypothetical protein
MSKVWKDRVAETTATTGTGTITGGGALAQYQALSTIGNGNTCDYCLLSGNGTDWETGLGTVTVGGTTTLARTTIYESSNAGAAISLSGTSTVFVTFTANRASDPVTSQSTPANPTGTSSTAGVMMGLAGTITPLKSTIIKFEATGAVNNGTANRGSFVGVRYGTGSAPTNGAATAGTLAGNGTFHNNAAASLTVPFTSLGIVTGLTVGTAYWYDLWLGSLTSGTSAVFGVTLIAYELGP